MVKFLSQTFNIEYVREFKNKCVTNIVYICLLGEKILTEARLAYPLDNMSIAPKRLLILPYAFYEHFSYSLGFVIIGD